ncbi:MAG: histidinol-phosphate transaminase [Candidatus Marinimicrobia bacterium]|jgi:histidinol-phosphate aminotransferase|nr:histidinol-phosphate transaminase [Candidatus Neomarinimicrobiota bacterium]MBT3496951.1 histidinol-phosphate transaminase [Candidatus Neomarinimicrobiota bacterium]MBT3692139.1 histidinol-phosphate transaminase [Candidatus Neomarinimicrobiota bacterium]MBT3732967.1 histidinol-phosphate transaminase [Candidatus Neomarinimicrobiota bacterium]MBT4143863.1 histidinol-phosphate transaminase [Candidatus Neomarinimicrobiota bacterium]
MALVPSYIKQLQSYKSGKSIEQARRELGISTFVKLASNENPLGPSPKALAGIKTVMENMHYYPEASGFHLRDALAKRYNVKIENVILGAGSEGVMSTIMRTFLLTDDELISAENSFIGFRVLANASGRKVHWLPMKDHRYDLNALVEKITDYTKIIYIANPDNPMGTYITRKEFDDFYKHVPERCLIILDEAYYEFAKDKSDYPDSMSYRYDNVITLRTFSKAFGLAGARIGYGLAHENLIGNLMKVKVPFEPSLPAQAAGLGALMDDEHLNKTLAITKEGLYFFETELKSLKIQTVPSAANFITTFWDTDEKAKQITEALFQKGFIVRQLNAFGWPDAIRISIGTMDQNQNFINTLKTIIK